MRCALCAVRCALCANSVQLKLTGHFNLGGSRALFISEIAFVTTLLNWIYWRLYRFPVYVIYSAAYYSRAYSFDPPLVSHSLWELMEIDFWADKVGVYWRCVILLVVLLLLHIYWTYLLLRIAYKIIVYGDTKKVEGEEYEINEKKKKEKKEKEMQREKEKQNEGKNSKKDKKE